MISYQKPLKWFIAELQTYQDLSRETQVILLSFQSESALRVLATRILPKKPKHLDSSNPNDIDFYLKNFHRAALMLTAKKQVCISRTVLSYHNYYSNTFSFMCNPQPMYDGGNKMLYRNCNVGTNFHFIDGTNWTLATMHTRRNAKATYWTAELFSTRFPHLLSSADLAKQPELRELLFTNCFVCNNCTTFNAILTKSPGTTFTAVGVINNFDFTTVKTAISYEVVPQPDGTDATVRYATSHFPVPQPITN